MEELLKSTYKPIEDATEVRYKERFESSLMRICVLALENDRMIAALERERVKNDTLDKELETTKQFYKTKTGDLGVEAKYRSKIELLESENE